MLLKFIKHVSSNWWCCSNTLHIKIFVSVSTNPRTNYFNTNSPLNHDKKGEKVLYFQGSGGAASPVKILGRVCQH